MIKPLQCRMARAALDWSARDLGRTAGVSATAIVSFESGAPAGVSDTFLRRLAAAFAAAGLILLPESEREGAGVRLSKTFAKGFIYDDQGKHVASIVGDGVYDTLQGRRIARAEGARLFSLGGDPIGTLQNVDVYNGTGSLPATALARLFGGQGRDPARLTFLPDGRTSDIET